MNARFDYAQLPVSRWRNGGGETREIISYPPGAAEFGWRDSIATIDADGPFSPFPGVDRVITLLQGDSVLLRCEQAEQPLLPHQPWAFPGEWAIEAQVSGSCQDFNIMTRRDAWRAAVSVHGAAVRARRCRRSRECGGCRSSSSWRRKRQRPACCLSRLAVSPEAAQQFVA